MRNAKSMREANGVTCVEFIICSQVYWFIKSLGALFFTIRYSMACTMCSIACGGARGSRGVGIFLVLFCCWKFLKFLYTQIIIIISAATAMISAAFSIRQTLVLSILKLTVAFSSNTLYSLVEYTPNVPLSPVVCQPWTFLLPDPSVVLPRVLLVWCFWDCCSGRMVRNAEQNFRRVWNILSVCAPLCLVLCLCACEMFCVKKSSVYGPARHFLYVLCDTAWSWR